MGKTMKDLGIDKMTPQQRVDLALEIWESLGDNRPAGMLSPVQRLELARRDAELDENPGMALSWEQIRARIENES